MALFQVNHFRLLYVNQIRIFANQLSKTKTNSVNLFFKNAKSMNLNKNCSFQSQAFWLLISPFLKKNTASIVKWIQHLNQFCVLLRRSVIWFAKTSAMIILYIYIDKYPSHKKISLLFVHLQLRFFIQRSNV